VKPRVPYGPRRVDVWRAVFGRGGGVSKEQTMTDCKELELDPGATPHDLLNLATEWLQYSRGMTELLAELVHESDKLNPQQMGIALEAVGKMTNMGLQCASTAHARMQWADAKVKTGLELV
jgi:hypothetical protein